MKPTSSKILVSKTIGSVSTLTLKPQNTKAVIALAHGAGAGMKHAFMERLAAQLCGLSVATVRYNFPYIENKKKMPDVPAVAEKTVAEVYAHVSDIFSGTPVFLAGKSFGGRMSSQFVSKNNPRDLRGIIFFGFPLHAPGKPDTQRAEHLKAITCPMLFLQGTNDALANISLIEKVSSALPRATLIKFDGANHSFKVKSKELIDELAVQTSQWIQKILG
jgi:predicted alpha/beta-hydrolase family hydrolase